jgi:ankyrin repeat protein
LNTPGFDPNAHNQLNKALIETAHNGHINLVELLLSKGANVNYIDSLGRTSLMWATSRGHTEIVKLLLNAPGFDPRINNQINQVLILADQFGHTEIVKILLISQGFDPNAHDQLSRALMLNNQFDATDVVGILKNYFAAQKAQALPMTSEQLNNALRVDARNGNTKLVKLVLSKGANVNHVDQHSYTALMHAAYNGHAEVIELLLKAQDFDPNAHNQLNKARMIAANKGHTNVLAILKNYPAALNAQALPVAAGQPEAQQQEHPAAQEESFWKKNCLLQ